MNLFLFTMTEDGEHDAKETRDDQKPCQNVSNPTSGPYTFPVVSNIQVKNYGYTTSVYCPCLCVQSSVIAVDNVACGFTHLNSG